MKTNRVLVALVIVLLFTAGLVNAQDETTLEEFPGQIAYIGTDTNVYLLTQDYEHIPLTDDAGRTRQYQWPTWSTDGRLAYFSISVEEGRLQTETYILPEGSESGERVYSGPEVFNYAYWSPGNCDASANCRDLAVLLSSQTRGMFVELIRDGTDENGSITAGIGGPPFYYSWSPDGGRMLWQRNNRRFDIYDANADEVTETLSQMPGAIFAPAWSPVDDRLLFGEITDDNTTRLIVVGEGNEPQVLAENFMGLVSFGWSPDGNRIAYREQTSSGFGPMVVLDAVTGETVVRSATTGVISFFWSPDSTKIAYLTLAASSGSFSAQSGSNHVLAQAQQQPVGIAWTVLEVESGSSQQYGSFYPTGETIYLLQYFDQFAHSHRIWSPDSRHIVYSEITPNGPTINLLDTTQESGVPFSIAEGVIGIWSFE